MGHAHGLSNLHRKRVLLSDTSMGHTTSDGHTLVTLQLQDVLSNHQTNRVIHRNKKLLPIIHSTGSCTVGLCDDKYVCSVCTEQHITLCGSVLVNAVLTSSPGHTDTWKVSPPQYCVSMINTKTNTCWCCPLVFI